MLRKWGLSKTQTKTSGFLKVITEGKDMSFKDLIPNCHVKLLLLYVFLVNKSCEKLKTKNVLAFLATFSDFPTPSVALTNKSIRPEEMYKDAQAPKYVVPFLK